MSLIPYAVQRVAQMSCSCQAPESQGKRYKKERDSLKDQLVEEKKNHAWEGSLWESICIYR